MQCGILQRWKDNNGNKEEDTRELNETFVKEPNVCYCSEIISTFGKMLERQDYIKEQSP